MLILTIPTLRDDFIKNMQFTACCEKFWAKVLGKDMNFQAIVFLAAV